VFTNKAQKLRNNIGMLIHICHIHTYKYLLPFVTVSPPPSPPAPPSVLGSVPNNNCCSRWDACCSRHPGQPHIYIYIYITKLSLSRVPYHIYIRSGFGGTRVKQEGDLYCMCVCVCALCVCLCVCIGSIERVKNGDAHEREYNIYIYTYFYILYVPWKKSKTVATASCSRSLAQ